MVWWGRRFWHLSRWRTACVVLYFTHWANSVAGSSSLSLSWWIKSNQWLIDGIMIVYRVDFSGLFWLSTDSYYLRLQCFSSSLTFFTCTTFPFHYSAKWGLPLCQEMDTHDRPRFIFGPRRKFSLGESVRKCFFLSSHWGLRIWRGALVE